MTTKNSAQFAESYFVAENLQKKRGNMTVNVSLALAQSTMTVIIGASGSGKSTTLRLIAGLEPPDKNAAAPCRLLLDGKDITLTPPGKRDIGMVFQQPPLFMHYNVRDNISYGLVAHGMSKKDARQRAEAFLAKINMAGFGDRSPETLSGGEAQRVALARTLITKPKLILFDEPLSALDAKLRQQLTNDILALQAETSFTGIWVTHDLAEAERLADRLVTMEQGHIIADTAN